MNIILVGGGKKIHFLIRSFVSKGHKVTVINDDLETCKQLSRTHDIPIINGDGSLPKYLEEAGVAYTEIVIALTPNDPDNLVICQISQKMYQVGRTIAVVNDPDNIETFKALGVDTVISTTDIISSLIEQKVAIDEITNITPLEEGKLAIMEVEIDAQSPAIGKIISELPFPKDAIIASIIRSGEVIIPEGSSEIRLYDKLVILSLPEVQTEALLAVRGRVD